MTNLSLLDIVDEMVTGGVECVIIGGFAVNFYGVVRSTEDIDLVFRRSAKAEQTLLEVFAKRSAFWISDEIDPSTGIEKAVPVNLDYIRSNHLLMIGTSAGYVDLFDFLPGLEGEAADEFFGSAVQQGGRKYASLDWLKKLKTASNRPIDQIDLARLP